MNVKYTMEVEIDLHQWSMCSCDDWLEQLRRGRMNLWSHCSTTEPEGIDNSKLEVCQIVAHYGFAGKLTCHIKGIFLRFPITRKRTSNLHIVISDHTCERTVPT